MFKKFMFWMVLWLTFFCNVDKVVAAFDLNITNATYDSNTGYLTIRDSNFSEADSTGYYSTSLSKIKLGGISITGSYHFNSGILKINVSNKDAVNEYINSNQNNIIENGLHLAYGAISKNTYPPNSINVVTSSLSNEKTINVNVIKPNPKITIDLFTSNILTINSNGGEIIVTVTGDNLDAGVLKVHNLNSSSTYGLTINEKKATAKIPILANSTANNRTDTFVLYLNGHKTDKIISVTVLPKKANQANTNSNTNNNTSGNGNIKPNDNSNTSANDNSNPKDNGNSNNNNTISKDDNHSNNDNSKDFIEEKTNKKSEKSIYMIVLLMILIIIIGIFLWRKRKG